MSINVQIWNGAVLASFQYTLKVLPTVPSITWVRPGSGSPAGGRMITILGERFTDNATVVIGDTPATSVTYVSSVELKVVTPPGSVGAADVVVATDGGSATAPGAFAYDSGLIVDSLEPAGGPVGGGTAVTIKGPDFGPDTAVTIDGTPVDVSFGAGLIWVTTPPGSPGEVAVIVTSGGIAVTRTFTYARPPVLSPAEGNLPDGRVGEPYHAEIAVNEGFGDFISSGLQGASQGLSLVSIPGRRLAITGTPTTDGTHTIRVLVRDDLGIAEGTFTMKVLPRALAVTSVSPNKGSVYGGTAVRIEGAGFQETTRVFIGGSLATSVQFTRDGALEATTPPAQLDLARTVDVWVRNANGEESPVTADTKFTYEAPLPVVDSVTPNSGPDAGGTVVTIRGSDFRRLDSWSVLFGDQRATNLQVVSRNELRATAPAGSAGPVDVTVRAEGGVSVPGAGSNFTYVAPLAVTSVSPASGEIEGGTEVMITGTGFMGANAVSFGGTAAFGFHVESDTQILAIAPARDGPSLVDVTVERPGESAQLANAFDYYVPLKLSPSEGDLPQAITEEPYSVSFTASGGDGTYSFDTSNIPTGLTASVQGSVLTLSGSFDGPEEFAFTIGVDSGTQTTTGNYSLVVQPAKDAPEIANINPSIGSSLGGTHVTIAGENFFAPMTVTFGGVPATNVVVVNETTITATTPAGPIGPVDVTVTRAGKSGTEPDGFTYMAPPTINAIAPNISPIFGGTEVTITGTGFTAASNVTFGGTAATFNVVDDTQIIATAPAVGSAGVVNVEVTTFVAASAANAASRFTYVGPPVIDAIAPALGPTVGGTVVTITGTGFTGTSAVSFGGTPATSFNVDSDTQITATTPAGAVGTIDLVVTALAGTSAASRFTYVGPPAINAIAPASGSTLGGTAVMITGTGFTGASAVSFGGIAVTSFNVDSDTLITATTPAGVAGTVDVAVTTPGGASAMSTASRFTYVAPPAIDAIAPALGPTAGGTAVTIVGSGFTGTTAVSFGGAPATNVIIVSDTQITAMSPAGGAGSIDVRVTTPYGTSAGVAASKFTYVGPPVIDAIAPALGSTAGSTEVRITGTGFAEATAVSFGGTAATSFNVNSDTQITATTPAGAVGTIDVVVTTPGGTSAMDTSSKFTYVTPPAIDAIVPALGPTAGGTVVTITGTGFAGATTVRFGGANAQSFEAVSDTQITATTPAVGGAGVVDVAVTTLAGTATAASAFTYLEPLALSPAGGQLPSVYADQAVSLTFTASGGNGDYSWSHTNVPNQLGAGISGGTLTLSGSLGAGTYSFQVRINDGAGGEVENDYELQVLPAPAITSVSPDTGPNTGGTLVTITGTGFMAPVSVRFGNAEATNVTLMNATTITATTPAGAAGTVDVTATSAGQVATLAGGFRYTMPPLALAPDVAALQGSYGEPLSYRFEASGGTAPYSYEYVGGTSPGLAFSVDTLSGTPLFVGDVPARITATDANGDSVSRDYRLIVAMPTAPVAADASGSMVLGNTSLAIDLTDKISGHSTSIAVATAPSHGTASVLGYVITYTPEAGFRGTDSFTYTASGPGGTSAPATVTVTVATTVLEISPSSLPGPVAGSSYEQMLTASGGVAPYAFSLASGTELPSGLELSASGLISGTPTTTGSTNFVVQATDADGNSTTRAYAVTVSAPTLTLAPATLPGGTGGVAYEQTITAVGGTEPYVYSVDGGSLPNGLALSRAGLLSGVPSLAGTYSFTVKATDQLGFTATVNYDLEIAAPVIAITPASLPDAIGGAPYDQTLTASGGTEPYAFQADGNLPGGIGLNSSGVFSGAPTKAGTFNFTVSATDRNGFVGAQAYSLMVAPDLPVALSRSVTMMAGTTATVNLTEGATGGPFTGAAIVTAPPAGTGTANLSGTELVFASHASASGAVVVDYTLSNRWGSSAPATITFVVQARPDPSKDPEVIGLIGAQIAAADRLASGQIDNFRRRLEQVHDEASRQAASFDIRFGQTDSTQMNYAEEENRKDIFSPLDNANSGGNAARNASNPPGNKEPGRLAFWTGGYVNFGSRDGNGIDFDHTMVGVSAGMDYRFTPSFVGGVGVGYGRDKTDIGDNGTESRAQALSAAVYGSYSPRPSVFLDGLLGYSRLDFDSSRFVTDTGGFAAGNRSGDQIFGSLVLGYEQRSGKFLLSPYGGLEAAWSQLGRFSETGAGLYNLTYDRMAASTLAGIAGLRFEYSVPTDWGMLKPRGRIEYSHDFAGSANTRLGYADLPGLLPYSIDVDASSTDSIRLELGLDANILSTGWLVGVDYRTAIGLTDTSSLNHTIAVRLGGKF